MNKTRGEIRQPSGDLKEDMAFFTKRLGFVLDMIYPADDPVIAVLSGHGLSIRLDRGASDAPATLRILTDNPDNFAGGDKYLTAPNGTRIEIVERDPPLILPPTDHAFVVRRLADQAPWIIGRAGMHYRDLIPTRLGGSIIASHIRIPDGGPVPDLVHYHKVGFQLIFCINGWVDVVYEDQGPPLRLSAGDCFIQPPEIRHRVLNASDGIEVIEVGVPADHITMIDHDMTLPTPFYRPERLWQGQKFVFNQAMDGSFTQFRIPGFEARDTTISTNTKGVASVMVARPLEGQSAPWARHDSDILFSFIMSGQMVLKGEGKDPFLLAAGDAFVIPPHMATCYSQTSPDLRILEVSLPGNFKTTLLATAP